MSKKEQRKCRCFVRHALTTEERKQVSEVLAYSRSIGDSHGTMLAVMQLDRCPTAKKA